VKKVDVAFSQAINRKGCKSERKQKLTAKPVTVLGEPGVTPKQYLNSQETILYESRPSMMSVVTLKLVAWVVIASAIFFTISAIAPPAAGPLLVVWFLLTILPLLVQVLRWRGMFFALTDQRILSGHGVAGKSVDAVTIRRTTGLLDVQTVRVTEVEMKIPFAGRIFGYGTVTFLSTAAKIDPWFGVKRPTEVRRFVEETMSRNQEVAGQQLAYGDSVTRTVAGVTAQQRMGFLPQQAPYPASMPSGTSTSVPGIQQPSLPTPSAQTQTAPAGFCVNCGAQLAAGTKFCPQCGTAVSQTKEKQPEQIPA
jgi:zinc-ribbon domain